MGIAGRRSLGPLRLSRRGLTLGGGWLVGGWLTLRGRNLVTGRRLALRGRGLMPGWGLTLRGRRLAPSGRSLGLRRLLRLRRARLLLGRLFRAGLVGSFLGGRRLRHNEVFAHCRKRDRSHRGENAPGEQKGFGSCHGSLPWRGRKTTED